VIVGIGLDYNVFLLVRVREYRMSGYYTTKESVALGLDRTGALRMCMYLCSLVCAQATSSPLPVSLWRSRLADSCSATYPHSIKYRDVRISKVNSLFCEGLVLLGGGSVV
jgi:hypothetical protein